jgi:hypothetical protein
MAKFLPSLRKEYHYQERGMRKGILMIVLIIVALTVFSFVGGMTGYMIYGGELESKVRKLEENLTFAQNRIDMCNKALSDVTNERDSCENNLSKTSSDLSVCGEERDELRGDYIKCLTEKDNVSSLYEKEKENYKELAGNSVQAICCSFSDLKSGMIKNWGIKENKIVCGEGEFTVNCATGETNI